MSTPNPNMTIEERARFAIEHPEIAHTPADLREIIADLLKGTSPIRQVRYCHECGTVGEKDTPYWRCCRNQDEATYVHPEVADQARLGFLYLIERENMKGDEGTHA